MNKSATTSSFDLAAHRCTMIAENAGQDGGIVCEKVLEMKGNGGYNALTDVYEDLVKAGVIDPTKVTRTALGNAASVATLLLTSDALVAEKPKTKARAVTAATTTCIDQLLGFDR